MIGNAPPLAALERSLMAASQAARKIKNHEHVQSQLRAPILGLLLIILALHGRGVGLDLLAAIRDPNELDYGEGIVWQQAALLLSPRLYSTASSLPFIVFHYPPVYLLFTRALGLITPNLLIAGRVLTAISACCVAALATMLVLAASEPTATRRLPRIEVAVAIGLSLLCVHAVRVWALFMRVDMLAEAFGLAGMLVSVRSRSWRGLTAGMLLCAAATYCKQTELPTGLAVAIIMMLRRPRDVAAALSISIVAGLIPLVALQWFTRGGFLENIIYYNVNRLRLDGGLHTLMAEKASLLLAITIVFVVGRLCLPYIQWWRSMGTVQRSASRAEVAREILLVQFTLSSMMLATIFKSGSNINYFVDWFCVGLILVGTWLSESPIGSRASNVLLALLGVQAALAPVRLMSSEAWQIQSTPPALLLGRIRQATLPVASENMVLLMSAGKSVVYEPAIVTELAALGRWDERPLVKMIAGRGFAFMLTSDGTAWPSVRRSAAVNAAMQDAYPTVEQVAPDLWLRLPPG